MLTKSFMREKETRRTVRFMEDGPEHEHVVGGLYVRKEALIGLGNPDQLAVVIGTPAEFEAPAPVEAVVA